MHKSEINDMQINAKNLKACAAWVSSIVSISELDSGLFSGIQSQKSLSKNEQECAKYIYQNFKKELSGIISFNQEMGINFQ